MMIELIHGKFEDISPDTISQVDLIIADPPDNIGLKYEGFIDKIPDHQYVRNLTAWLHKMSLLTKGPIFLCFNEKWTYEVEDTIRMLGIPLVQRIHWFYTFGQDQTGKRKYGLCHRPIYWLNFDSCNPEKIKIPSARQIKYNDKRAASGGKMPPNVWEFPRVCGTFKERRKWCPTQLPEALVERIVKGHCRQNGRVLDPFMGTGTTPRVCQRLGVDCVGIEISESYIDAIAKDLGVSYTNGY